MKSLVKKASVLRRRLSSCSNIFVHKTKVGKREDSVTSGIKDMFEGKQWFFRNYSFIITGIPVQCNVLEGGKKIHSSKSVLSSIAASQQDNASYMSENEQDQDQETDQEASRANRYTAG